MLTQVKDFIVKYWKFLLAGIGTLVGLFLWNSRKDAKADLDHANNTTDNVVTQAKIDSLSEELKAEKERIEKEKGRKLSDSEMVDFLKRI